MYQMKKSLSKYLIVLAFLLIGTYVAMVSRPLSLKRHGGSTNDSNTASSSNNLNTQDTLGVSSTSKTKENLSPVQAEQTGSSPESGATSTAKQVYDFLVSKGTNYGNVQPADWSFNFGTYWNRMLYSAFWEPDGNATESDVLSGKTFYSGSNNRVQKTGTLTPATSPGAYEQQYMQYDDYEAGASPEDSALEESSWTNPATNVWKDTRTGLYWSNNLGNYTNSFPNQDHSTCDFFSTVPRGSYGTSGTDPQCGNAINACAVLNLTSGGTSNTDWYLPSQKELMRAYVDGMYNKAGATFTTTGAFWSSTERSDGSDNAWIVNLGSGNSFNGSKTNGYDVRCVRRD
jgi:hypothetical protein